MTKQRFLTGPLGPSFIQATAQWLQALGAEFCFSHDDQYRIELCLEELVSNVVSYSDPQYAKQALELRALIGSHSVALTLIDPCAPFDPLSRPAPVLAQNIDEMQIGGQGIPLVREFSDACRYERSGDSNTLELVFNLTQATAPELAAAMPARGAERRCNADTPPYPFLCQGVQVEVDRRQSHDRRAMGFISSARIFQGVPYAALEGILEPLPVQEFTDELLVLKPGQANHAVRLVLQGGLKVFLDKPGDGDFIAIGAGACVGEMSVIDDRAVSAYVLAERGTRLLVIDAATFLDRIMVIPRVSRNLMTVMSERMRLTNQLTIQHMRQLMETEQAHRELQYARSIQESLLPREPLFADESRLDCVGRVSTAREVGGDFYDLFFLDARHLFFVVADVCGKGLPAALFMVRAITVLRAQLEYQGQTDDYAGNLVASLNEHLCAYNDAQQFLTAFCGILDLDTLTVRYINAGHNPPLLAMGNGAFQYLSEPINPLVGMIPGLCYRAGEVKLMPGSVLLLYTDGVTEAEAMNGDMLGEDRLLARLNAAADRGAKHLVEAVFDEVTAFAGAAEQSDDITVLAIRCAAA